MPRQDVLPVAAAQETDRTITDYDVAVKGYVAPNGCHGIFSASYYFTVISARKKGTATIKVKEDGTTVSCKITVK